MQLVSKKEAFTIFIHNLQDEICETLEAIDGKATFVEDRWEREGGGGGKTRVIENGGVFEKGGVNTSVVHGELPELMQQRLGVQNSNFFACGISLVLHPESPMVPTVHANYRYFELYDEGGALVDQWFGGGADLTPYYVREEDAIHFHKVMKGACDSHGPELYSEFKKACDDYFHNAHRVEARGIGGLFFDYLRPGDTKTTDDWFAFVTDAGDAFLLAYVPIVDGRKEELWNEEHKYWQEIRRGRYVEFNLIHDRGTLFGLKTNGRVESILMSLPPTVRWDYNYQPEPGSAEAKTLELLQPQDWINFKMTTA